MANHEDVGCSEHQIRLSKGVIAKFVQPLGLRSAIQARRDSGAGCWVRSAAAHACICGRPDTHTKTKNATDVVAFCVPSSVTETVLYFKNSKLTNVKRQVFARIPDVGVTSALCARGIVSAARNISNEKPTYRDCQRAVGAALRMAIPSSAHLPCRFRPSRSAVHKDSVVSLRASKTAAMQK